MRIAYILWLRQIKKYLRSKSRIIGSLAQPLLFLLAFNYGFGSIYQKAENSDYLQFLAPGIILMSVLFTGLFSGIEIIWDKQFGFLKETLVAPTSRLNIVIGRTLGGATVATIQGIIVFIMSLFIGFRPVSFQSVFFALFFIFLVALLFTSLGTIIASKMDDMQGFQLIMNFLVMPVFFMSGAMFPLDNIPQVLLKVTKFNPLTYGVDAVRGSFTNAYHFSVLTDLSVLVIVTVILLSIGSFLFERIQV